MIQADCAHPALPGTWIQTVEARVRKALVREIQQNPLIAVMGHADWL